MLVIKNQNKEIISKDVFLNQIRDYKKIVIEPISNNNCISVFNHISKEKMLIGVFRNNELILNFEFHIGNYSKDNIKLISFNIMKTL